MNKQMMDLAGYSSTSGGHGGVEAGKLFDLKNIQEGQHSHGGSSDNVSGMRKKQEIISSKDFLPTRTPRSANYSSEMNVDGVARSVESGGSGSNTMTFSNFLEPHEQPKVSCEMERDACDVTTISEIDRIVKKYADNILVTTISEIDRIVKKYADNILHTLEGVSSRLVQLESKTQQIETSVDELMNKSGSASGKLSQLENILREVQTGAQVIHYKQEIAEAQFQLSNHQQPSKQDQTPSPLVNSNPVVSQQAPQQSFQPPLPTQPSYQQPPPTSASVSPQIRISLTSPPPHSHHAPKILLPRKCSPSAQPSPQTLPQSQHCQLPQGYPRINCQPDLSCGPSFCDSHVISGSRGGRNNAVKRKSSSMQDYEISRYVGEDYVKVVVGLDKKKGKRWNENDQVNLAKAWSCVSNSSKNGVNHDEKSFWKGIMKEYNANYCPAEFRSIYGLKSYWKLLKRQCLLWKKVLSHFNSHISSDSASTNLSKDAKTKFKSLNNGRKFEYKAAFEVLKECPKWSAIDVDMGSQRSVGRTSTDTSQDSSEASMPSGSNTNTPTSDVHLSAADVPPKCPHKFISKEECDEHSDILFLEEQ